MGGIVCAMVGVIDYLLAFLYLLIIYLIAHRIKIKRIKTIPIYKYFIPGLMVRILGGFFLCFIYLYYYEGGDTLNYYKGSICMINLLFENPAAYFDIMMGDLSYENYLKFNHRTGYPPTYMYSDANTFSVIRLVNPLVMLGFNHFIPATILLAALAYSGPWRMFLMFCREFPGLSKQLAVAILFVPSVFFWGSGMLKDTFTFSAACWYTFSFYKCFIVKEKRAINFLFMLLSMGMMVAIKPYLFVALFPGSLIWYIFYQLKRIQGFFAKALYFPLVALLAVGLSMGLLSFLGQWMGKYALGNLLDVAVITQNDLVRDVYGENSFNIGTLDKSTGAFVSKVPAAIIASFFRPFIWEVNNPVMFLSGLENLVILVIFITTFVKIRIMMIVRIVFDHPIILFSMLFSLIMAYSVGLTTANFGALVRYKIPLMPFLLSSLMIIQYYYKYGDTHSVHEEIGGG